MSVLRAIAQWVRGYSCSKCGVRVNRRYGGYHIDICELTGYESVPR